MSLELDDKFDLKKIDCSILQCPLNFWSCNKPLERVWINERKRVNANNYRKPFGDDLKSAKN